MRKTIINEKIADNEERRVKVNMLRQKWEEENKRKKIAFALNRRHQIQQFKQETYKYNTEITDAKRDEEERKR